MKAASKDMTSKLGMLKKRSEFLYVRDGFYAAKGGVVVQMRENQARSGIGMGFTATKKIGNAVARNRAKRRLRAASAELLGAHGLVGVDYVFIARQETGAIAWTRLLDDMERALISLAHTLEETVG